MVRVLVWLLVLALTVYTVVDCVQTEERRIRTLPKALWVLLILVLPLVGPIAWLIAGRPEQPGAPRLGGPGHRDGPPRGPDDDPDFLRRL
jgi:hypothetical protein